jgi:hypothetical protein
LHEWEIKDIQTLWDFCDGLEYQLQFNDHQMFQTMEQEGAVFMWFARNCLSRKNRLNLTRGLTPSMWERSTASMMCYHPIAMIIYTQHKPQNAPKAGIMQR